MPITFYPYSEDMQSGSHKQKLETLMEAAERYKAAVLDVAVKSPETLTDSKKRSSPSELTHAFNWQELAKVLRELRELPEVNQPSRLTKAEALVKLANVYEVLRGAKMPKLEAVRLALINEAKQLNSSAA